MGEHVEKEEVKKASGGAAATDKKPDPSKRGAGGPAIPIGDPAGVRKYVAQPGDSVWALAEQFFGHGDKYKLLVDANKATIGSAPYLLAPGQILNVPPFNAGPAGVISAMTGDCKYKAPRDPEGVPGYVGLNIKEGASISTGDDSSVTIVFADGSDIRLGPQALLVIYGQSSKTARVKEKEKTQVLLKPGTVPGGLAALDD